MVIHNKYLKKKIWIKYNEYFTFIPFFSPTAVGDKYLDISVGRNFFFLSSSKAKKFILKQNRSITLNNNKTYQDVLFCFLSRFFAASSVT